MISKWTRRHVIDTSCVGVVELSISLLVVKGFYSAASLLNCSRIFASNPQKVSIVYITVQCYINVGQTKRNLNAEHSQYHFDSCGHE